MVTHEEENHEEKNHEEKNHEEKNHEEKNLFIRCLSDVLCTAGRRCLGCGLGR
jgi:hypothetical protein